MGLREVEAAADQLREALAGRAAAMATALREGHSVADVARAARVTRQTVYRLTDAGKVTDGRSDTEVLDAGLGALLESGELSPHASSDVLAGLQHADVLVKARRLRQGVQSSDITGRAMTDELRDALVVAGRLLGKPSRA